MLHNLSRGFSSSFWGTAKKLMFPRIPFKRLTFLKAKMHGGGGTLSLSVPHTPGSAQRGAPLQHTQGAFWKQSSGASCTMQAYPSLYRHRQDGAGTTGKSPRPHLALRQGLEKKPTSGRQDAFIYLLCTLSDCSLYQDTLPCSQSCDTHSLL